MESVAGDDKSVSGGFFFFKEWNIDSNGFTHVLSPLPDHDARLTHMQDSISSGAQAKSIKFLYS